MITLNNGMCKRLIFLILLSLMVLPAVSQEFSDTLFVDLRQVIKRTLERSPELDVARANRQHAEALQYFARANRFLTEVQASSAVAVAPGISNPNGVPNDALYLDPDVRNDFSNMRPFAQVEVSVLQPLHTWGELGGSIRAATQAVQVEVGRVQEKELTAA